MAWLATGHQHRHEPWSFPSRHSSGPGQRTTGLSRTLQRTRGQGQHKRSEIKQNRLTGQSRISRASGGRGLRYGQLPRQRCDHAPSGLFIMGGRLGRQGKARQAKKHGVWCFSDVKCEQSKITAPATIPYSREFRGLAASIGDGAECRGLSTGPDATCRSVLYCFLGGDFFFLLAGLSIC